MARPPLLEIDYLLQAWSEGSYTSYEVVDQLARRAFEGDADIAATLATLPSPWRERVKEDLIHSFDNDLGVEDFVHFGDPDPDLEAFRDELVKLRRWIAAEKLRAEQR